MTWRTQLGVRTLQGAEAALVREALASIVDMIDEELTAGLDQWEYNVRLFDDLPPNSRLALLAQVGWALLRDTETYPPLTAINEAAVGAIFSQIEQAIRIEIDTEDDLEDPSYWRSRVLAVFQEEGDTEEDLPSPDCTDPTEWEILMEVLSERILWDRDFNDADVYLDKPPEHATFLKDFMTIDDDYFTAVAPDPRDSDMPRIRAILRDLCPQ